MKSLCLALLIWTLSSSAWSQATVEAPEPALSVVNPNNAREFYHRLLAEPQWAQTYNEELFILTKSIIETHYVAAVTQTQLARGVRVEIDFLLSECGLQSPSWHNQEIEEYVRAATVQGKIEASTIWLAAVQGMMSSLGDKYSSVMLPAQYGSLGCPSRPYHGPYRAF